MPSVIWTKGPVGGRLVQCWGAGELCQGGRRVRHLLLASMPPRWAPLQLGQLGDQLVTVTQRFAFHSP